MQQDDSKLVAVLSIAFITILILLVLNFIKVYQLKKENNALKKQIENK